MEPLLPEISPQLPKNSRYLTGEPVLDRQLEQLHNEVRSIRAVLNELIIYLKSKESDQ